MKVHHYIVTYRNPEKLNACLRTLVPAVPAEYQITVINNHSHFHMDSEYTDRVGVLHNVLRPDFSTGHLARNWNQAIVNGFRSLQSPECDVVVTSQDDTEFLPDYYKSLQSALSTGVGFIQQGAGDEYCAYTPDAVRMVGLWDERFCNIGYQEADYFLRVLKFLPGAHVIADHMHGRLSNPVQLGLINKVPCGAERRQDYSVASMTHHTTSLRVFHHKWGEGTSPEHWRSQAPATAQLCDSYLMYPYFEKDIQTLQDQRYIY